MKLVAIQGKSIGVYSIKPVGTQPKRWHLLNAFIATGDEYRDAIVIEWLRALPAPDLLRI